ncbi:MAG: class III poly(R)-hydroxyalkanoic acid synthase subunit PhaE [Magnetococcales bacterium]|nr:class III poly(R)-hydroxyalkanoic acid synthase subunit PhaE [Magnetococcales bacterium]
MADLNSMFSTDWMKTWSEFQQKAMSSWLDSTRQTFVGAPSTEAAVQMWRQGLEQWQKLMAPYAVTMPGLSIPGNDFMKGMMSFGESYSKFVDIFTRGFGQLRDLQASGANWKESVEKFTNQMKEVYQVPFAGKAFTDGLMGMWGQGFSAWQQMSRSVLQLPDNPFQSLLSPDLFKGGKAAREQLEKVLLMPAIGPNPEVQAKYKKLALLALKFQEGMEGYAIHLNKLGPMSLDKLKEKLTAMGEKGEKIDTLQGLFDLLVKCGDSAYAELSNAKEYRQANADMVHAMMRLKAQQQELQDDMLISMNLPSRRELNTTNKRVIELKRGVRQLKNASGVGVNVGDEFAALRREIEELKREIDELKGGGKRAATARKPQPAPAAKGE